MSSQLRFAHFVQRYPPALGGSEAYFARLSRYLVERGHHVTVFTTTALELEAFRGPGQVTAAGITVEDGIEVRRFPLLRLPAQRWLMKAASLLPVRRWQALTLPWNPLVPSMWRAAGSGERFDVVHATAFPYGWVLSSARRMARRLSVPFLLTPFLHTGDPYNPRDKMRRTFTHPALLDLARSADRLFVQTEGERRAFLDRGIVADRLILQGMGVDAADCIGGDRAAARAAWGIAPDAAVVGHLANLSREKGTLDLLAAAEEAWRDGGRFELCLAGPETASFGQNYEQSNRNRAGRVHRLGVLDDRQKRDFFAAIDIFALPSRVDSFGLVLLEAWANGIPVVAYRAGGVPWVVRDEEDGLLVRCGDSSGLEAALRRLTEDAEARRRFGAAGRARTATEFRWEDKLRCVEEVAKKSLASLPRERGE